MVNEVKSEQDVCACLFLRSRSPDVFLIWNGRFPTFTLTCGSVKMVRLITHNLLACHAKGCTTNNFPLQLKDVTIELREAEFNPDFVSGFLSRLEWTALVNAAKEVCALPEFSREFIEQLFLNLQLGDTSLPPELPDMVDDDLLKNLHHVLLEVFMLLSLATDYKFNIYAHP